MASTSHQVSELVLADLHTDLLFSIACFMTLKDITLLRLLSKNFKQKIDSLERHFIERESKLTYSPNQLRYIPDCVSFFKTRKEREIAATEILSISFFSKHFSFSDKNHFNEVGVDVISSLPSFLQPDDIYYHLDIPLFFYRYKAFGVNQLRQIITKDQTDKIFKVLSFYLDHLAVCPYLADIKNHQQFKQSIDQLSVVYETQFNTNEFKFIYLFPAIMASKAFNCFDLLSKTYFALYLLFRRELFEQEKYKIERLIEMVLDAHDPYFLDRLLQLSMTMFPKNGIIPCLIIKAYLQAGYDDSVQNAFLKACPEKKRAVLQRFQRVNGNESELHFLNNLDQQTITESTTTTTTTTLSM